MLQQVLNYAKTLIESCTNKGEITVDATVGRGNDTLFLSNLVGPKGIVFEFDIQTEAIEYTKELLSRHNKQNVILFQSGHEQIESLIPIEYHTKISSAIFNLGYLPNGNKSITTKAKTTIEAVNQLLKMIRLHGMIVIVVYYGHNEGKEEMNELLTSLSLLNQKEFQVLQYRFINQINDAPFLLAIEKIRS